MRHYAIILLSLFSSACATVEDNYKPVTCNTPLPYEGAALYQVPVKLPPKDFTISTTFDKATKRDFDQAMNLAMTQSKAHVMSAAVATRNGIWHSTRSIHGPANKTLLYWASVGKAFTATVIMQLVEEGKITLDQPVSQWIPNLPNASSITIDHLLQHTSGLFSANEDMLVRNNPRYRSPEENINISTKHGAMFCPGQHWRYSNTGYTVLGKIIEQVDGRPYHQAVNARITRPLQLPTLQALAPLAQGENIAPLIPDDGTSPVMSPSWGFAAGNVVGSAEDMLNFWHALLSAKLLNEKNTDKLFTQLYPMFDKHSFYGRGVMLYVLPDDTSDTNTWLGHGGGTPGAKAIVAYSPKEQAFVAVALTGDGSAEASAYLLLKQVNIQNPVSR